MHDQHASTHDRVAPEDIDWELLRLRPPTRQQLALAQRVGRNPDDLFEAFMAAYSAACAADTATADRLAGAYDDPGCDLVRRRALGDCLKAIDAELRDEWFVQLSAADNAAVSAMLPSSPASLYVSLRVDTPPRRGCSARPVTRTRSVARPREHRRSATRSSAKSGDSGDDGPGDPAGPALGRLLEGVTR
ncbi:MAG: hypothetical protein WKF94_18735 [Solirubrobacteraceae bacterium]